MHEIQTTQEQEIIQVINSLGSLCESIAGAGAGWGYDSPGPQISQTNTMFDNLRWYLVSNLQQLLSQMYVEHGLVQTLVDQPVEDAFRSGYNVKTKQLNSEDLRALKAYCERNSVDQKIMQGFKWTRLYGGGAVLIITDQNPMLPLNLKAIKPDSPLEFRSCDMWELYYSMQNITGTMQPGGALGENMGDFYNYYGQEVHQSRVLRMVGKEAPAFIRPRLRGWGMSELERLVRSLNQYLKNQDVIFALLDEAKVDVYKMQGFNDAMLNSSGTEKVSRRIQGANYLKGFNNALLLDANDDYIQKQIAFTGLAEVLTQIRQGIAADLKMPMTKLFGISSAGFNSGEDDIENYNSMIESEIRQKVRYVVVDVLQVACQKLFGFVPDDLAVEFNPLRILNAKEEEEVKNMQFNRALATFQSGLTTAEKTQECINHDALLPVEIEIAPALPPIDGDYLTSTGASKVDS